MSDDERDLELETAEKRAHHNALERKRRDHIKDSFSNLRESVPTLTAERVASRAQILKKAADYIQFMRKKNSSHQHDIDDLKRQNTFLENQIRTLEKAKATGNFAVESGELHVEGNNYQHSNSSNSDADEKSNPRQKKIKTKKF